MTTFSEVSDFVAEADRVQIERLWDLCRDRMKHLNLIASATALAELKPGDRVRVKIGIKPKYLAGSVGVVQSTPARRLGSINVKLDHGVGKFYPGSAVGFPASCLEKIS